GRGRRGLPRRGRHQVPDRAGLHAPAGGAGLVVASLARPGAAGDPAGAGGPRHRSDRARARRGGPAMSGETRPATSWRLVALIIGCVLLVNVGGALLFDRDEGLGADEALVALIGVMLAVAVEYGVFRRTR